MEEINLTLTTTKVEGKAIPTKYKVVMGKPVFGIHRSCWKEFGIKNRFQYWLWKREMRKNFKLK